MTEEELQKGKSIIAQSTPAPWEWWTSCSFRRLTGPDGRAGGVAHAYVAHDGVPDINITDKDMVAIEWLRNNAEELIKLAAIGLKSEDK